MSLSDVLILLLFAGGVMNIAYIAGMVLFALVEKLAPTGGGSGAAQGCLPEWGLHTLWQAYLISTPANV